MSTLIINPLEVEGIKQFTAKTVDFGPLMRHLPHWKHKAHQVLSIPETIGSVVAYNIPSIPEKGLKLTGDRRHISRRSLNGMI
jgi:hypothetical protein